jgi:hypothetical protein
MNWFKQKMEQLRSLVNWSEFKAEPYEPEPTVRWVHVSKKLAINPLHEAGVHDAPLYVVSGEPGNTWYKGTNQLKRFCDGLGANNKQRRRIRAKAKQSLNQRNKENAA